MKQEKKIRERVDYRDIREMIEDIGDRFRGHGAYAYRLDPRDKEIQKKSYEELRDDVRALSTAFIKNGLAGKHITLIGKLSYNWVLVYYAALCTASVLTPLDREWSSADLSDTAKRASTDFVVADGDISEKAAEVAAACGAPAPIATGVGINELLTEGKALFAEGDRSYYDTEIDPLAMAQLVFTSGTTGKGKGVMLSQRAIIWDLADVVSYIDFSDKSVGVLPPHHTYGSSVSIYGQNSVGIEVYISSGIRYVVKELKEQQPGHLVLVPLYIETFYRKIQATLKEQKKEKLVGFMIKLSNGLRKIGIDLRKKLFGKITAAFGGRLNLLVSGGAAINEDIIKFFDGIGITILNGYGITECAPLISVNHSQRIVKGSVGFPIDGDEVRIDDPNEDGEGEIQVKGPNVMLGYFGDEAATADAMTEDGYFRTGDYGKIDKNGAIHITGRKKNLIILSNGKNVYPEEIESEFVSVPGVLDIIVYEGQSKRGSMYNTIVAEIYPDKEYIEKNGITDIKAHLQSFVNEYNRSAVSYKKIGVLKVRDEEFPKNTLRKIMRFKLDMTIE
ncbi:MAG: AMP-binding protein [Clostridia bacterium]|nr:AMP-binding protein [Clostridia bacterium]